MFDTIIGTIKKLTEAGMALIALAIVVQVIFDCTDNSIKHFYPSFSYKNPSICCQLLTFYYKQNNCQGFLMNNCKSIE